MKCFIKNRNYNTRAANIYQLDLPPTRTALYVTYSFRKKVAQACNEIQKLSILGLLKDFKGFLKSHTTTFL